MDTNSDTKSQLKHIKTALVSVFHKDGLDEILSLLAADGVKFLSTGGTRDFITSLGYDCDAVEDRTGYPSILGGRVKTLHPKVFGGILSRRDNPQDCDECVRYDIADIDLVIVDLYPFEQTVASGASEADIIEKIDIGGISLIRAAAKNFADTLIVASKAEYSPLRDILRQQGASTTLEQRKFFARRAFGVSSGYDTAIYNYFAKPEPDLLRIAADEAMPLRYGENPHQPAAFFGRFNEMFDKLHGKEVSYNNILDIDAAVSLAADFEGETFFAILKHNNACGVAVRPTVAEAWRTALSCDPVSAFGGVLVTNAAIDAECAAEIDKIFFEVIIAPEYSEDALQILEKKKNRIILRHHPEALPSRRVRSALNGYLVQQTDNAVETEADFRTVTDTEPTAAQKADMVLANKIVKHSKSNAIVLAKDGRLCASGVGQTSRVDALKQAIEKARAFEIDLDGAVMASDAFFPFADCVQIAHEAGVTAAVQPGGSIRDAESIDWCNDHGMAMVMTGVRHFKH